MKARLMVAAAALSFVVPTAADAQSNDVQYCSALRDTYTKYVMVRGSRGARQGVPANVATAMSKCETGDVTWAIAVLEEALRSAKVDLPPRG